MKKWLFFVRDFRHYLWLGIVFLLVSLFLSEYIPEKNLWWNIGITFLQTLGISMIVASLFSYVVDSMSFQRKLQILVENIVLKRDFLRELPLERKKEALHYLIKPSEKEIEKYSNIESFYNYFIDEIVNVAQKNIRSNYVINLRVCFDREKQLVYSTGTYSYRLYPSINGYTDIVVGVLKDDDFSEINVFLNYPNGQRDEFEFEQIQERFEEDQDTKFAKIEINDLCKDYSHIDIEMRVKEYGKNHWMIVFFKAMQATDGFQMNVVCEDDIEIQNYLLFDVGHNYHIDILDNKKHFHISCSQWISEGAGVALIVSKPECDHRET